MVPEPDYLNSFPFVMTDCMLIDEALQSFVQAPFRSPGVSFSAERKEVDTADPQSAIAQLPLPRRSEVPSSRRIFQLAAKILDDGPLPFLTPRTSF